MSKTVSSLVLSDFEDASTGDRFAEGDTVPLERGVFDNFETAGLVRENRPSVTIERRLNDPDSDQTTRPPDRIVPTKRTRTAKRPRAAK